MPSDIGAVANAVSGLANVAYEILHRTQDEKIATLRGHAQTDVESFKRALLVRDFASVRLMLDGLQTGLTADIAADELSTLENIRLDCTAYSLLGYYCRARESQFLRDAIVLRETADKPK